MSSIDARIGARPLRVINEKAKVRGDLTQGMRALRSGFA
jgi:hypothetical protein